MADDIKYQTMTTTVVRGLENRSRAKWEAQGWEFVSDEELPMLRTTLTFRRPAPKVPWKLLAYVGAAVGVLAVVGIVASIVSGSAGPEQPEAIPTTSAASPAASPADETPAVTVEEPEPYAYAGPQYEEVAIDEGVSAASLDRYWIYTEELDVSTDAYRDQVKAIIDDIAHRSGTTHFFAEVVDERDIALAESASTYEAFVAEHGAEYAITEIPRLQPTGWIASFTGGYDSYEGAASDDVYELLWWPVGEDAQSEVWIPTLAH